MRFAETSGGMNATGLRVTVLGAAGLVGGELLRLLSSHPHVAGIVAVSKSGAGQPAHAVHPCLLHRPPIALTNTPAGEAATGADVVFCALAHGESQRVMPAIIAAQPRLVVDLGADFRLQDAAVFRAHYGEHCCPELAAEFVYGLPEAFGDAVRRARRIANPGCFATATQLLLLPLAATGLLPEVTAVSAVTGSSGAGAIPKPTTHHPWRDENLFAYKLLEHPHEAEIAQTLTAVAGNARRARLLPHSGPFVRGIHATAFLRDERFGERDIAAVYREYYREATFVRVLDRPPQVAVVAATNFAHVHVTQRRAGAHPDEVALTLVLDNLGKGAAGQAIHNMNLALGLPETAGIDHAGVFPC
jgi:N-acetyl-gamma-glutamyl-phosphate reductase